MVAMALTIAEQWQRDLHEKGVLDKNGVFRTERILRDPCLLDRTTFGLTEILDHQRHVNLFGVTRVLGFGEQTMAQWLAYALSTNRREKNACLAGFLQQEQDKKGVYFAFSKRCLRSQEVILLCVNMVTECTSDYVRQAREILESGRVTVLPHLVAFANPLGARTVRGMKVTALV